MQKLYITYAQHHHIVHYIQGVRKKDFLSILAAAMPSPCLQAFHPHLANKCCSSASSLLQEIIAIVNLSILAVE
jgi:hypothetical protein